MAVPIAGLTSAESNWIEYIWSNVVGRLRGSSDERARTAAIVTWWALKEGVLDVRPNPWRHNLCGAGGDHPIGDLEVCPPGSAWQVGMAGIQPNNVTLAQTEAVAREIYPGQDLSDVLRQIARDANVSNNDVVEAIATSTDQLRKAWLLRDPAISFTLQRVFVDNGCVRGSYSWCYGGWDTARRFASSGARVKEVIGQLESYYRSAPSRSGSSTAKRWAPLVLIALGAGAYYLYSTSSGKQVRRRIETRASRLLA